MVPGWKQQRLMLMMLAAWAGAAMMLVWGCAWVVAAAADADSARFLSAWCHDSRFGLCFERQHRRLTVIFEW